MEQSHSEDGEETQSNFVSEASEADYNEEKNEIFEKILQLMNEDKTVTLTEVVNETITSLKQQKQIALLHKNLKQVFGGKQLTETIHLSEKRCLWAAEGIEQNRNSLASKLNHENNEIASILLFFDKLRSQLKTDCGVYRARMDILNKRLNEMKELVNKQEQEYDTLKTRYNNCKSELTGRIDQLKTENEEQRAAYNKDTAENANKIQEYEAQVVELSKKLTEKKEEVCKLQTETEALSEQYEAFKLAIEKDIATMEQEIANVQVETKKQHDEELVVYEKKNDQLKGEIQILENVIQVRQKKIRDLTEVNDRFRKLQEQRKQTILQRVPTTKGPEGTRKRNNPDTAKLPSSVNTNANFDLDCIESYHYDNEMSLKDSYSFTSFVPKHKTNQK